MKALVALLLATLACTERSRPPSRDSARVVTTAAPSNSALETTDSLLVEIDRPTLIAFYPAVTQAQVDSSEELATVFDDFSYHLSSAADSLRALGFKIESRPLGGIRFVEATQQREFLPPKDSADFGYLFLAPGRAPRNYYGVMSSTELAATAHEYLENRP